MATVSPLVFLHEGQLEYKKEHSRRQKIHTKVRYSYLLSVASCVGGYVLRVRVDATLTSPRYVIMGIVNQLSTVLGISRHFVLMIQT